MALLSLFGKKTAAETEDFVELSQLESSALVPFEKKERHRFTEHLLEKGLISKTVADSALQEQRVTGDLIGAILVRNGFLRQEVLVPTILEFNTSRIATEQVEETPIHIDVLERHGIIVSAVTDSTVFVGALGDEVTVGGIVEDAYPGKKAQFVAFLPDKLGEFLDRVRRNQSFLGDEEEVRDDEMLDSLLGSAIKQGASDVHIEPREKSYSVFFRILGERRLVHEGTLDEYNTMVSQLKDRGRMDLAERRVGQDGGFQLERGGRFIDLRATTVPTRQGEVAVIRILDPDRVNPSLSELGISRLIHWERGTSRKEGLCLICGATGSGKTTTLNSTIRKMDRFGRKIYTIEDPVEYTIPFVTQVSVNNQVGLDYARGIRNFMRGDPDVIVIGEIRDQETARNAIAAADTGHLVLGTLHTSSIVSTFSRLRDLGVQSRELVYNLRSILVQTLVKVTCKECSGLGHVHDDVCRRCKGEGYTSRTVISECASFQSPREVEDVIAMISGETKASGVMPWPEIIDDAIDKMVAGVTDMEEIRKVFGSLAEDRMSLRGLNPQDYMSGRGSFQDYV